MTMTLRETIESAMEGVTPEALAAEHRRLNTLRLRLARWALTVFIDFARWADGVAWKARKARENLGGRYW